LQGFSSFPACCSLVAGIIRCPAGNRKGETRSFCEKFGGKPIVLERGNEKRENFFIRMHNHTEIGPQVRNSCCSVVAQIIRCPAGNRESRENEKFVRVKSSKKPIVLARGNQERENFLFG
jgi:hypothetical protein